MTAFFVPQLRRHNNSITYTICDSEREVAHLQEKSMNARHALIALSFLQKLQEKVKNERFQNPVHPAFETLLNQEELISVIQCMYENEAEIEYPNLKEKSKKELVDIINDDYYILCWLMEEVLGRYTL